MAFLYLPLGGLQPPISLADLAQDGATLNQVLQWNGGQWAPATIGGTGTVTSVGLSLPSLFSVSGSPVTSSGTLTATYVSTQLTAPVDGNLLLQNAAGTGFGLLQFGGTTNLDPAIKRLGTSLFARTADDTLDVTFGAGNFATAATGYMGWNGRSYLRSPVDGDITLLNAAGTDFNKLNFGGTTSSFPALKRSTTELQVRLADDSAFSDIRTDDAIVEGAVVFGAKSIVQSPVDGDVLLSNSTVSDFSLLQFGGTTSSFPALLKNGTSLIARLADNSANTGFEAANFTANTTGYYGFATGGYLRSGGTDGILRLSNATDTTFIRLQLGGSTSSFPSLQRSGANILVRLADNSGDTGLTAATLNTTNTSVTSITSAGGITLAATQDISFTTRSYIGSPSDGVIRLMDNAGTAFNRIQLGGTTSAFPALQRNSAGLRARLADDSANTTVEASQFIGLTGGDITQVFGSGEDGNVTFDGSTTVLGFIPSAGVYNVTRDLYCNNVTITGATTRLQMAGYKLFVKDTLDISSATLTANTIISCIPGVGVLQGGNGAAATTAGAAGAIFGTVANMTLPGGIAGVTGGTGTATAGGAGTTAGTISMAIGDSLACALGGAGGTGAAGAGGAAGTSGVASRSTRFRSPYVQSFIQRATALEVVNNGRGSGGGAGGGGTGNGAGGGGSAGQPPLLYIAARNIIFPSSAVTGIISNFGANGGNGGSASQVNAGGGGGGAGGSGGYVHIAYETISGDATNAINITGGTGGAGGNGNGTGLGGAGGGGGPSGQVAAFNLRTGIVTITGAAARTAPTAISGTATGVAGVAATTTLVTLV